jgi:hypothetical protein
MSIRKASITKGVNSTILRAQLGDTKLFWAATHEIYYLITYLRALRIKRAEFLNILYFIIALRFLHTIINSSGDEGNLEYR